MGRQVTMLNQNHQLSRFQTWLDYNTYGWKSWAALGFALMLWVILFGIGGYLG
jgi:hypothetical protein